MYKKIYLYLTIPENKYVFLIIYTNYLFSISII